MHWLNNWNFIANSIGLICYLPQANAMSAAAKLSLFTPHRASSSCLLLFSSSLACCNQLQSRSAKPWIQLTCSTEREFGAQFWRHWSNNSEHCPASKGSVRLWDCRIGTRRRRLTCEEKETSWSCPFGFTSPFEAFRPPWLPAGGREIFDDKVVSILDFCECQRPSKARCR